MAVQTRQPRLAVLIDGENISAVFAERIFAEAERLGIPSVLRIYGDLKGGSMAQWLGPIDARRLVHRGAHSYTKAKNSSDIALCIDAMDLLHTSRLDGFCIVSSDGDFTHLAVRAREHGLDIYGIGEAKAGADYKASFDQFIVLEKPHVRKPPAVKVKPAVPSAVLAKPAASPAPAPPQRLDPASPNVIAKRPPTAAVPILKKVIPTVVTKSGWARITSLENRLKQQEPGFKPADFGSASMADLLRKASVFDLSPVEGEALRVRVKPPAATPPPKPRA